jgi:preprotein translocase subunit SecG
MGGGGGFLTSRGTSNVLTKTTASLAVVFFITSLALSLLAGIERKPRSILEGGGTPAAPEAPARPGTGGVLDTLRGGEPPSGPQVPRSQ